MRFRFAFVGKPPRRCGDPLTFRGTLSARADSATCFDSVA
jgi:hypothetical protein